jgi:glycosyltransferase involved in cell wall biosynthesis
LLVADGAQAFAREILRLLEDGALRRRVGEQGRCYVTTHHNWAAITVRLEELYRELAFDRSLASDRAIEQAGKDGAA